MNGFWAWYAGLPEFSMRHPVLGLIISCAILYAIFMCPLLALRLLIRLCAWCLTATLALIGRAVRQVTGRLKEAC